MSSGRGKREGAPESEQMVVNAATPNKGKKGGKKGEMPFNCQKKTCPVHRGRDEKWPMKRQRSR